MSDPTYSLPEIYEIAFSFRNYPAACDFITEAAGLAGLTEFDTLLELGSGPGQYCREFSRRGKKTCGLDLSPAMVTYLKSKADEENLECTAVEGDMRNFQPPERVSLVVCMMATPEHLLTNRDMLDHLDAVADALREDGIYIMEFSHPDDIFNPNKRTKSSWSTPCEGGEIFFDWGCGNVKVDPLTEIATVPVRIEVTSDGHKEGHEFETQTRSYTAGLIRALVELSGRFKIANMYGDLDVNQPFDNSIGSWRMILVLRKWE